MRQRATSVARRRAAPATARRVAPAPARRRTAAHPLVRLNAQAGNRAVARLVEDDCDGCGGAVQRRILGIENRFSHGEAQGNTGGDQTTVLEADINGSYIGKFDNRKSFMNKGKVITAKSSIPGWVSWGGYHKKDTPHAEDYLFAALKYEWDATASKDGWGKDYPTKSKDDANVLDIRADKTPCPDCATNLATAGKSYGLTVVARGAVYHQPREGDKSGYEILTGFGHYVVPWSSEEIEKHIKTVCLKKASNCTGIVQYRQKSDKSWKVLETLPTVPKVIPKRKGEGIGEKGDIDEDEGGKAEKEELEAFEETGGYKLRSGNKKFKKKQFKDNDNNK